MCKQFKFFATLLLCAVACGAWAQPQIGTIKFGSNNVNIKSASVTGDDNLGNTCTFRTEGTSSFTPQKEDTQVGSSNNPATSITFTMTMNSDVEFTMFSAKFGGFSGTSGHVNLEIDGTSVKEGSLTTNDYNFVASNISKTGKTLTVTVTNIQKGVKCYEVSYSYNNLDAIPYTVTLGDDNSSLTEESPNAGVTLPSRSAIGDYTFAGWSETNVTEETTTAPAAIIPAGTYHPTADVTLYPVYTQMVIHNNIQQA